MHTSRSADEAEKKGIQNVASSALPDDMGSPLYCSISIKLVVQYVPCVNIDKQADRATGWPGFACNIQNVASRALPDYMHWFSFILFDFHKIGSFKYVPCVNIDKQADRANFPSDC